MDMNVKESSVLVGNTRDAPLGIGHWETIGGHWWRWKLTTPPNREVRAYWVKGLSLYQSQSLLCPHNRVGMQADKMTQRQATRHVDKGSPHTLCFTDLSKSGTGAIWKIQCIAVELDEAMVTSIPFGCWYWAWNWCRSSLFGCVGIWLTISLGILTSPNNTLPIPTCEPRHWLALRDL